MSSPVATSAIIVSTSVSTTPGSACSTSSMRSHSKVSSTAAASIVSAVRRGYGTMSWVKKFHADCADTGRPAGNSATAASR